MDDKEVPARGSFLNAIMPCRFILATLGSFGMAIVYGLKVNLSVAIVSMVKHTADHGQSQHFNPNDTSERCFFNDSSTANSTFTHEDGPFDWTGTLQGTILSSYFWGYIVAQLPGGRVAELFSAKWVMFFSVAINVVCTFLTPLAAKLHFGAVLAMRIGEGIGGGVTFPAMHVMLAHWALPNERSVMSSIVYAGTSLGTVASMFLSGITAAYLGWEAVFYIQAGLAAIWLILWAFLVSDSPETLSIISESERKLITSALRTGEAKTKKRLSVPWKSVFTSMPFWAILVAHVCSNWGWYMVLIELPLFMKNVLHLKLTESANYISISFLLMWFFSMAFSRGLDYLRAKGRLSTTSARKIATLCASFVPMVCFVAQCYIGCSREAAIGLTMVAVICIGGMFCGFLSNHIDIAPNYAGTLVAITNTVATLPGIIVPIFVGKLTENDTTIKPWRIIFWTTVILYLIEIIFYTTFGSGDEQEWNKQDEKVVEAQPLKSPDTPGDSKQDYESTKN